MMHYIRVTAPSELKVTECSRQHKAQNTSQQKPQLQAALLLQIQNNNITATREAYLKSLSLRRKDEKDQYGQVLRILQITKSALQACQRPI